jgi:hypothetical protein
VKFDVQKRGLADLVFAVALFLVVMPGLTAAQVVYLEPALSDPLEPQFTLEVMIDTADLVVSGLEIEITFDTAVVGLDNIDPGAWITTSGLDYFFFDDTSPGTNAIHFDMAFLGQGYSGAGQLAVCHFMALEPGDTPLNFTILDARDGDNAPLVFGHSEGDLVHIRDSHIFVDPSLSIPGGEDFTVALAVETPGQAILGMSIILTYNPAIVRLNHISPGQWITSSGLNFYFHDHTPVADPNQISFDMAFLDGPLAGTGEVAVCFFTAIQVGQSPLVFEETDIRDQYNSSLQFTHSVGDLIIIDEAIPVQETTLGRIKTLYR